MRCPPYYYERPICGGSLWQIYREYSDQKFNHVVAVVDGWTHSYRIRPWFVFGRKDIVIGEVRDRSRSWFWQKA